MAPINMGLVINKSEFSFCNRIGLISNGTKIPPVINPAEKSKIDTGISKEKVIKECPRMLNSPDNIIRTR
jgi:hypothetical protein